MTANSKTNVLYQQVRDKIVSGEIKPGAILTESGLSDEYGVSKAPAREALVLLGHEGLVESMPRTGHVVATVTVQDVLETFHLRSILEAEAAGLAAIRQQLGNPPGGQSPALDGTDADPQSDDDRADDPVSNPILLCPSCGQVMQRRPIPRSQGRCPP